MPVIELAGERVGVPTSVLGRTGARISSLALGTDGWVAGIDADAAEGVLRAYLEAGGDTLEVSARAGGRAEEIVGAHVGALFAREDVMLVGRSAEGDCSRRALMRSLDATLGRLGTEHLDLWLVDASDAMTPAADVAASMEWALTSGRATYVGVCGVPPWRAVDLSHELAGRHITLTAHGLEYNLLERGAEGEAASAAAARGHGIVGGAALAGGVLTGKYRHATPAESRRAAGSVGAPVHHLDATARATVESLATAAEGLGVHPTELALAWALRSPSVDALVVGARTPTQLRVALRAAHLAVPEEILTVLDEVSQQA